MKKTDYLKDKIDIYDEDYKYNTLIKTRLFLWKEKFTASLGDAELNYSGIASIMQNEFGIQTSAVKVGQMFDPGKKREVKLQELAALAQIFDIPIWDIIAHPVEMSANPNLSNLIRRKKNGQNGVEAVSNRFYEGRYYCYYFKPKHFDDQLKPVSEMEIEEAEMRIEIKEGHTVLTLREMKDTPSFYGDTAQSFTLSGDLYRFENTDIAYSFINDRTGRRAMAIMFTYLNLSADVRYYITAGIMTFSLNQHHDPLFEKMAIFREQQDCSDPEVEKILRGTLALNSSPLILSKSSCERLSEEDPALKQALSPERALQECYVFSEHAVRSELFSVTDPDEKVRKQLKLRSESLCPAHEVLSEPDYFADFMKAFQQMQMAERKAAEEE